MILFYWIVSHHLIPCLIYKKLYCTGVKLAFAIGERLFKDKDSIKSVNVALQILSIKKRIAIAIASAFAAYLASRYILKKGREKSSRS